MKFHFIACHISVLFKSQVRSDKITYVTQRILQVLAILSMSLLLSMIIHKGFTDISNIYQENPETFWGALGRYFFDNMAGVEG